MKNLTEVAMEMAEKIAIMSIVSEGKNERGSPTTATGGAGGDMVKMDIYEKELKRLRKERD